MRKLTYLAILEPSKSGYGIYFPDVQGCISCCSNISEAQKYAQEALGLHIYGIEKDNEGIPKASDSVEVPDNCLVMPVTIYPDVVKNKLDNQRVKINCTIPYWLKVLGENNNVNFSQLLETALRDYLQA